MHKHKPPKELPPKSPNSRNRLKSLGKWFLGTGTALAFAIGLSGGPQAKPPEYCRSPVYSQCIKAGEAAYCRDEHCPDKKTKGEKEISKFLHGREFTMIYPQSGGFDNFAGIYLRDSILCYEQINDYLGIEPAPLNTRSIASRIMLGSSPISYTTSNSIMHITTGEFWEETKKTALPAISERLAKNVCSGSHELTHLFVTNTPIPAWLNEGLATIMEYKVGIHMGEDISAICLPTKLCHPTYCSYPSYVPGEYMDLSGYDDKYDRTLYYYTAMCFWYDILNEYGRPGLKRIMKELSAETAHSETDFQKKNCIKTFQLFEKALGKAIPDSLLSKYGLFRDMTSGYCGQK